jgi:hypothetical protein
MTHSTVNKQQQKLKGDLIQFKYQQLIPQQTQAFL